MHARLVSVLASGMNFSEHSGGEHGIHVVHCCCPWYRSMYLQALVMEDLGRKSANQQELNSLFQTDKDEAMGVGLLGALVDREGGMDSPESSPLSSPVSRRSRPKRELAGKRRRLSPTRLACEHAFAYTGEEDEDLRTKQRRITGFFRCASHC